MKKENKYVYVVSEQYMCISTKYNTLTENTIETYVCSTLTKGKLKFNSVVNDVARFYDVHVKDLYDTLETNAGELSIHYEYSVEHGSNYVYDEEMEIIEIKLAQKVLDDDI